MQSFKRFFVNALIRNLLNLLSLEQKPVYSDIYWEMLSRLLRTRRDLAGC